MSGCINEPPPLPVHEAAEHRRRLLAQVLAGAPAHDEPRRRALQRHLRASTVCHRLEQEPRRPKSALTVAATFSESVRIPVALPPKKVDQATSCSQCWFERHRVQSAAVGRLDKEPLYRHVVVLALLRLFAARQRSASASTRLG